MRDVTFTIYPDGEPQEWITPATVHGDWAAHHSHPIEEGDYGGCEWHVTQLSTGVLAFVAKRQDVAIRAAKRLAGIESPMTEVTHGDGRKMPHATLPSLKWLALCADALDGLDVWCVGSKGVLVRPSHVYAYALEARGN